MKMLKRCGVLALAILPLSCGSSSTSPSNQNVAGTWVSSSICCGAAGQGDVLTVSLSQSGATISGSWVSKVTINVQGGNSINGGQLSGTVSASMVAMTLTPDVAAAQCTLAFSGTLSGTTQMVGTISTSPPNAPCSVTQNANVTFAKQ